MKVSEESDVESSVFLAFVVQVTVPGRKIEARMETGLQGVDGSLHHLRCHRGVVSHLADLAELQEAVDVAGGRVQNGHDQVRVEALDSGEKSHLDLLVGWTVVECEPRSRLVTLDRSHAEAGPGSCWPGGTGSHQQSRPLVRRSTSSTFLMSHGFGAYNTGPENSLHLIFWVEMFVFNAEDFPQGKIIFLLDVVLLPTRLSNVLFNPLDSLLDVILVNVILTRSNCQLLPTFLLPFPLLLLPLII